MDINISISLPSIYAIGLGDTECNDPLNDGIYSDKPFLPRNTNPPHSGKTIPQVRKLEEGLGYSLTEPVEWLWYWAWRCRVGQSLNEADGKNFYRSKMRGNAAFTNKAGSDTNRSFILKTNTDREPMRSEGVTTPDNNLFRLTSETSVIKNKRVCYGIWCLDYGWLKTLTVVETKDLATHLPAWLWHIANDIHSNGEVTQWDYGFGYPLLASSGRSEIIDGWHCRENHIRISRLRILINPNFG